MKGKLFVLTRNDLSLQYQAPQAVHAAVQWMLENEGHEWRNDTLILKQVPNEEHLKTWCDKLEYRGIKFSKFYEPDIGNQLTSISCYHEDERIFKKLKLMGQKDAA